MRTNVQQNKQLYSEFQKALNRRDWSVSALKRYVKPDVIDHTADPDDLQGLEGVHKRLGSWYASFDDATEINLAMVGEQQMVSVLYRPAPSMPETLWGLPRAEGHHPRHPISAPFIKG